MDQLPYAGNEAEPTRFIGCYRLERIIGRGGMGVVYLATRSDNEFRKHVAIKILQGSVLHDDLLKRFRQERQILASLEHPNIARLIDGGTTEAGEPYFVMEYVSGGLPLDRYCEEQQLSLPQKLRLFLTVCSAVQYAHQRLVVHRDLKPGNILVSPEGVVKLLDFGIAKALFPQFLQGDAALTQTGVHAMTPEYASPEQVRGDAIGVASDVYTLGVVLYQLLTGRLPFHQGDGGMPELMRVVCEQEPRKPSTVLTNVVKRELAGDLDNIVLMSMRKEPERRYGSADQLGEDIRRYLEGLPVAARPATAGYRASKFLKRHAYAAVAVALFIASLVGGIIATTRQARIAEANAARAQARFDDIRKFAGSFIFDIETEIAPLQGSTKARKMLVAKAQEYLELLSSERSGDKNLGTELATAYAILGGIQRSRNKHSLGDTAGSRASYLRAVEVANSTLNQHGEAPQLLNARLRALAGLGDLSHLDGNHGAALQYYRDALADAERMLLLPAEEKHPRSLLPLLGKLAELHMDFRQPVEALRYHQRASELSARLLAESPKEYQALRDRHVTLALLASYYLKTRQWEDAIRCLEESRPLLARMATHKPGVGQRDEMVLEAMLGKAHAGKKQYDQAAVHHRRQLGLAQAGFEKDKNSVLCYYDLSSANEQLARVLVEAGRADEAKPHAEAAIQVAAQAERIDPSSTMTLAHINSAMLTQAMLQTALKNDQGAEQAYHRMIERNERAVRLLPSPGLKQELAKRYEQAAEFHREQAMKNRDRDRHLIEVHRLLTLEIEVRRQLKDQNAVAELQNELRQLRASTSN